jgi:hypothetical protein
MTTLKEYVITVRDWNDVDPIYDQMEAVSGSKYIPDRRVEVVKEKPISRSTHYLMTDEEAQVLKQDPRILDVDIPTYQKPGVKLLPCFEQYSNRWDKSFPGTLADKNWALPRCTIRHVANWGSDNAPAAEATVNIGAEGRNVDVIVADGHVDANHPELVTTVPGGPPRVTLFNWLSLNPQVIGGAAGVYNYTVGTAGDNNHGQHVAGTIAGNTLGWARSANIYNISPYTDSPIPQGYLYDYIRFWHKQKAINPITGFKNPTIVNMSYGYFLYPLISSIFSITYRGVTSNPLGSSSALQARGGSGISGSYLGFGIRSLTDDTDIQDAIADGIVFVGAAGNANDTIVNSSSLDFENSLISSSVGSQYYMKGSTPGSTPNVICVGAVDATATERKASFSATGSRIDIFAPGKNIMSSVRTSVVRTGNPISYAILDPSSNYYYEKYEGTSMASPQVCGALACEMENYPTMNQTMARTYITNRLIETNALLSTGSGQTDYTFTNGLRGAPNNYLKHRNQRNASGAVHPNSSNWLRPTSGLTYPRSRNKTIRVGV